MLLASRFHKKPLTKVAINIISVSKTIEIYKIKGEDVVLLYSKSDIKAVVVIMVKGTSVALNVAKLFDDGKQ